jgi:SAM-dependent methyltransferase
MKKLLPKIPAPFDGAIVEREEGCNFCNSKKGKKIGEVDYWDVRKSSIIQCEKCGLAQLDPMLSEEETAAGCLAYYYAASPRVSEKEKAQGRNLIRNFRRGYLFGVSLKRRGFSPNSILELGPGSGYFSEGLKFIFPHAKITMMDINSEVLRSIKHHHGYHTIQTSLEQHLRGLDNHFDLIIARDVLEHVIDVAKVIENIKRYSKREGLFHFITPNGHEDVWKHYLTYHYRESCSELLINHVNYFDGEGLLNFLVTQGFSPVQYYTYKLKTTFRGRGWKVSDKLMAPVSRKKPSAICPEKRKNKQEEESLEKERILDKWYIRKNRKGIAYLISWFHHASLFRLPPEWKIGHEIYGLFRITKP